jgi:nitrous oxidase accessory protein NosD
MHRIAKISLFTGLLIGGTGLGAMASAQAAPGIVVRPGQSIQGALDSAPDGATVTVVAGSYAESLTISKPVTLSARGAVTLRPPLDAPVNGCTLDPDVDGAMPGICVIGQLADPTEEESPVVTPVRDVHISGFTIRGFANSGVEIYGAHTVSVSDTTAAGNRGGGFWAGRSADVVLDRVIATDNGARGVDIQEGTTEFRVQHATISDNTGEGVFVGDSEQGVIAGNLIGGNCSGVLVLDERTGASDVRIEHNTVVANNRFCPADEGGAPSISGNGVVLAGARDTTVAHNMIVGHAGAGDPDSGRPAQFSVGGLAVLDAGPLTGGAAPSGDNVAHNLIVDNAPLDVLYDGSGTGNQFSRNVCVTSTVPGICGGPGTASR